jgi:hypothetical protein
LVDSYQNLKDGDGANKLYLSLLKKQIKDLLFFNRPWPIRIWMWSAVACFIFYLIKYSLVDVPQVTMVDTVLMTYGIGSLAIYVLIFGFDWS